MPRITIYFDEKLAEQVKKIANKTDRSFSYVLRQLTQEALEARQEKKQAKQTTGHLEDL